MKNLNKYIVLLIALSGLVACEKNKTLGDLGVAEQVYMPQAAKSMNFVFQPTNEIDSIYVGMAYAGIQIPQEVIEASLIVRDDLLDSLREADGIDYKLLPSSLFDMDTQSAVIPAGRTNSEPILIKVMTQQLEPNQHYALPLQIAEVRSDVAINPELSLTVISVKAEFNLADFEDFARTDWKVVDFSSHDPWEGGPDGHVNALLNDNPELTWISHWSTGEAPLPHHITIDMKTPRVVHGISFVHVTIWPWSGQGGQPKDMDIFTSMDGESWAKVGSLNDIPKPQSGPQAGIFNRYFVDEHLEARYVKVVISDVHDQQNVGKLAILNFF